MADKKNKTQDDLEARKKEIQAELDAIQNDFGDTLSDVRNQLNEKMDVWYWIKKYPIGALGAAFLIGLSAGKRNSKSVAGNSFSGELFDELRRVATQKAVRAIVKQIEDRNE